MAAQTQGAFAPADLSGEIIVDTQLSWFPRYYGRRAALEAEGVIPKDLVWPEKFTSAEWEENGLRFELRRLRPAEAKGPRKQFESVDWWLLAFRPANQKPWLEREVERRARELAEFIKSQRPDAVRARGEEFKAWYKANRDPAFQAFKARLPLPSAKRRGRPVRSEQEANHV